MLRNMLIMMALAAPGHALAVELWCMPDTLCRSDVCKPTDDEEASVRLNDLDSATPVLRMDAKDIPLQRTAEGDTVQWQGEDPDGGTDVLAWRRSDNAYVLLRRVDGMTFKATGRCEIQ